MSSLSDLPSELIYEILEHLLPAKDPLSFSSDPFPSPSHYPSLCSAALVSRAWREPASQLLHRHLVLESFPLQSLELIGVQLDKLPPTGWRGSNSALPPSFRADSRTKTWQFRHQKYFLHTTSTPLSTRISRCTSRPAPVIFHSQDAGGARLWGQLNSPRRHYGVQKLPVKSSTTSRRCRPRGNISPQPPQPPSTRPCRPSARASLGAGDKRRSTTLDKFTIIGTPRPSPRPRSGPGLPPHSPANPP